MVLLDCTGLFGTGLFGDTVTQSDSRAGRGRIIASETVRVIGVAIIDEVAGAHRVLAARRTAPPAVAGGWELPGGKCEPGEAPADAAAREVEEELGCRISVTGALAGVEPIGPGLALEVVTAALVEGVPVPTEHDEVRWLGAEELDTVRWLPADLPFLAELAEVLRDAR